jgi:hypothetical protein
MIDITETKEINDEPCANSVKGCEVGLDVACIKDIKLSSNICNPNILDR